MLISIDMSDMFLEFFCLDHMVGCGLDIIHMWVVKTHSLNMPQLVDHHSEFVVFTGAPRAPRAPGALVPGLQVAAEDQSDNVGVGCMTRIEFVECL